MSPIYCFANKSTYLKMMSEILCRVSEAIDQQPREWFMKQMKWQS